MRHFSSNLSPYDVIKELDKDTESANFRKNKRQPSQGQTEEVVNIKAQKKLTGIGSIVSSFSDYAFGDDTTTFDTQKLRDSLLYNPITYRYCKDLPREALYHNWKIIPRDDQPSNNEGLRAILYWKNLFEADPNQVNLDELLISGDEYYRLFGEVAFELRFARSPLLKMMGFNGEMLKYIDPISPMLLPQSDGVQYDENGKIKAFKVYDKGGVPVVIDDAEEVRRIVYFHNQPSNEHRGISRLRPLLSILDGYDDLRELNIMMMEHLAMPVEFFTIDETGLTAIQSGKIRDDLETELDDMMTERRRVMITNKRVEFDFKGVEGKNLDIHVPAREIKGDIYQGMAIPLPYVEAEGSTKSTVEVQHQHYLKSQLMAQDQAFGHKLTEQYIFPLVLRTMGVDVRLTPMLHFPEPYTFHDVLAIAQADAIYMQYIGEPARQRVIEREGFKVDENYQPPTQKEKEEVAIYKYRNGYGREHQVDVRDSLMENERNLHA